MILAELTQLIIDYLENQETSFVTNIPQIIKQGEARIYNTVRTIDQRKTVTFQVSTATIMPPEDFLEPLYLYVDGEMMLQRSKSFLRTMYGNSTGNPAYYCLDYTTLFAGAQTITIAPIPTVEVDYELNYIGTPYSIVDQDATWLSVMFPEVLLYSCLIEGYVYNKGEVDMMAVYQRRFDDGLVMLKRSAEGLSLTDEYRNTPVGAQ